MSGGMRWADKDALVEHSRRIASLGAHAPKTRKRPRKTYGVCPICGGTIKGRKNKTCSESCGYTLARQTWAAKPFIPNKRRIQCGKPYHSYQPTRMFCSYQCHLDSGGALRAGLAARTAKMKYGAKKDANHRAIIDALRDCGVPTYDLSDAGRGIPDCIVWVNGQWHLVEIKNPQTAYGKRGLNPIQRQWLEQWQGGPVFIVRTVEEAIALAKGQFPESSPSGFTKGK